MQQDSLTIYCPNVKCRAANPEEQVVCHNCQTRLPKRYLRVVNFSEQEFVAGDTLDDRFVFRGPHVVLDVRPSMLIKTEYEIPDLFLPYLKLFPHRIHYPQFFGIIWVGENEKAPILLLDKAPLSPNDLTQTVIAEGNAQRLVAPIAAALPLTQAWPQARPLRLLNWLWQLAHLWDPFLEQKVAISLTTPGLLRVEGPLLRVLELHNDIPDSPPSLMDLGQMLSKFKTVTSGSLNFLFEEICDDLVSGKIDSSQSFKQQVESAMATCQDSQVLHVSVATKTDPGVVRNHNEDQCFPPSGSYIQGSDESVLIVCDGVGGHAGGEVASAIAIEALQEHLGNMVLDALSPEQIKQELVAACCHANDLISQRNDQEQRQERARMGTTLVMALVHDQQLYVAHIGDSRAYLVTKLGCYQLTVDDDIASREVRLGYLPYQEAVRQPTSGSLVQALGMASSIMLHPTVQRFFLDDECVLLLCSDGLSDYDRVEELWQEELLPLLYRNYDLASVSQRLITLANHLNGHDNVTVGLMNVSHGNQKSSQTTAIKREPVDIKTTLPNVDIDETVTNDEANAWVPSPEETLGADGTTQQVTRRKRNNQSLWMMAAIWGGLGFLLIASGWAAFHFLIAPKSEPTGETQLKQRTIEKTDIPLVEKNPSSIQVGQFLKVKESEDLPISLAPPNQIPSRGEARESEENRSRISSGSIVKIIKRIEIGSQSSVDWFEIEVCYLIAPSSVPDKSGLNTDTEIVSNVSNSNQAWVTGTMLHFRTQKLDEDELPRFEVGICNQSLE